MRQTELVSASRVVILEQLSASIGEINQPIAALVLNAQVALRLLLAQPTDTGAVKRLLACIVKDGLRTGDIVHRTRAEIEKAQPVSETQCPVNVCAVRRRRVPVGASSTRQTLQPEATGAVMEATKWLKGPCHATLARIRLSGKIAHDDLVCPPSVSP